MSKAKALDEAVEHTDALLTDEPVRLTRDELRAKLIGSVPEAKAVTITVFGVELELRQPTFASIMETRENEDTKTRATDMIIKYAYVPGTDQQVFEETDRAMILRWPFGEDLLKLQEAISDLTGLDIEAAKEDLKKNPLD